ncbi:winged helix-turn-helix domain-containing protein [Rhizobium sp. L245/93]|uniref:winged helix-turn-helix domain-containing protein n=1 Tax=Rhizobium sp. L245/93 TaxID=2819998 RepID=UPI001AD9F933|nr:winged helix-turn-helix domain-containing protein [Rhizobium sp. L245/93]MBO9168345.1 winged helix-turn-helix domain-containing protein [Rhizobium sp. L245/93]
MNLKLATRVAAAAGLTLLEAVQSITAHGKRDFASVMDEYLKSDGFKSMAAEQELKNVQRRRDLLKAYGDQEAVLEPSALEVSLHDAVSAYPVIDGGLPTHFRYEDLSPLLRTIFAEIEPVHASPAEAMTELEEWRRVHRDRQAFFCYDHDWWIDGRKRVLEHIVDTYPVTSLADVQARIQLWKLRSDAGDILSPDQEAALQQQLLDDIGDLQSRGSANAGDVLRTATDRTEEVCRILKARPDLSNREIARRVHVSPQTVANHRDKFRRL